MSTQIIAFAKETKSKKLLFQELPYHAVNEAFQGVKATCDTALKTGDMGIFKKREVTCLRC